MLSCAAAIVGIGAVVRGGGEIRDRGGKFSGRYGGSAAAAVEILVGQLARNRLEFLVV